MIGVVELIGAICLCVRGLSSQDEFRRCDSEINFEFLAVRCVLSRNSVNPLIVSNLSLRTNTSINSIALRSGTNSLFILYYSQSAYALSVRYSMSNPRHERFLILSLKFLKIFIIEVLHI